MFAAWLLLCCPAELALLFPWVALLPLLLLLPADALLLALLLRLLPPLLADALLLAVVLPRLEELHAQTGGGRGVGCWELGAGSWELGAGAGSWELPYSTPATDLFTQYGDKNTLYTIMGLSAARAHLELLLALLLA